MGHWHFAKPLGGQAHLHAALQGMKVFKKLLSSGLQMGIAAL
jgi:hypothetical protein